MSRTYLYIYISIFLLYDEYLSFLLLYIYIDDSLVLNVPSRPIRIDNCAIYTIPWRRIRYDKQTTILPLISIEKSPSSLRLYLPQSPAGFPLPASL